MTAKTEHDWLPDLGLGITVTRSYRGFSLTTSPRQSAMLSWCWKAQSPKYCSRRNTASREGPTKALDYEDLKANVQSQQTESHHTGQNQEPLRLALF